VKRGKKRELREERRRAKMKFQKKMKNTKK
jgi:hypothetical protein